MNSVTTPVDDGKESHDHGLGTDAAGVITVNHHCGTCCCGAGQVLYVWADEYVLAAGTGTIAKSIGCVIPDGDAPDVTSIGHIE